jgi:hypothetical protein
MYKCYNDHAQGRTAVVIYSRCYIYIYIYIYMIEGQGQGQAREQGQGRRPGRRPGKYLIYNMNDIDIYRETNVHMHYDNY